MSRDNKKFSFEDIPGWVHLVFIGIIVLVIAFSIFKLVRWNMGTAELDTSDTGSLEVEVLDQVFLLTDDKKAGHEYDDEETILFLGNDALTYDASETGVANQIGSKLGATVINCGFPGSTVANKNTEFSDDYKLDAYSFVNVVNSMVSGDFSRMEECASSFDDYAYTSTSWELKNVDMNKVDTIVIYYNAQDYLNMRVGMNPDNEYDPVTYRGALNSGIKALQEKYPYIRIVCLSFTMCYAYDSNGQIVSGDRVDFGNGKLTTYLQFMIDVSGERGVTFIDDYYGTIHEDNSTEWLLDNIHVNAACNEHVAQHFVNVIYPDGI